MALTKLPIAPLACILIAVTIAARIVRVAICTCQRCGHEWEAIIATPPAACMGCKSRDWQRPSARNS